MSRAERYEGRDWHDLYLRGLMSQLDLERYETLVCERRQLADELRTQLHNGEDWDAEMAHRAGALLAVCDTFGYLLADDDREISDDLFSWPVEDAARTLEERTVIRLVNLIIVRAIEDGAQRVNVAAGPDEIHVEAAGGRRPGGLVTAPLSLLAPLLARLKRVARLDPAVCGVTQAGHMPVRFCGVDYLVQVTVTRDTAGERAQLEFSRAGAA